MTDQEILKLNSHDLLRKGGFWDGDQFADYLIDNNFYVRNHNRKLSFDREVLYRIINRYLIPKLPVPVKLQIIITPHNPFIVADEDREELQTQPETIVTITIEQLNQIAQEVKSDYTRSDCKECNGTGEVVFTKERGGPICNNCGGNGYLTDEIIKRIIASILDYPSVYMGGPSEGNKRRAQKIIEFLKEEKLL